ncbi:MAG: ATP-grasp domain-containing protein [Proteobacteria bacterium]|nr:ATP-grasp domain-containing protein [Pseudomonadota bacterium]
MIRRSPVRVVFVAPFFFPATLRFLDAVASLPGVPVAVVSQAPLAKLPEVIRRKVSGHYRVEDALNAGQLANAVKFLARQMSGVERLFGALEHLQVALGQVRDHLGIPGISEKAARNFRDKAQMKGILRANGLPCARHGRATSMGEARAIAAEIGLPVVIKPPEGAGAVATYRVSNGEELRRALIASAPGPDRPIVIEEFVSGRENSLETVCIRGRPVWDSHTRYTPAPLQVLETPWIQWTVLLPREEHDGDTELIRRPARAALEVLGMHTGLTHLEWFRTERGPAISEVAARPPGAQIVPLNSYAHEADFHHLWARLMVHEEFEPPVRKYSTGVAFFRGQSLGRIGERGGAGRIIALRGLDRAQDELGHLVVEANLPKLGRNKQPTYEGDGYAILRHPDTGVVEKALQRLVSLVQVEVA